MKSSSLCDRSKRSSVTIFIVVENFIVISFLVLIFSSLVGGLGWLVFGRCRFSLAQLFGTLFVFGALMSISKNYFFEAVDSPITTLSWAIAHLVCLTFGLFIGARTLSGLPKEASPLRRWVCFFCSLLFIHAVFGAAIMFSTGKSITLFPLSLGCVIPIYFTLANIPTESI
jgi:hypothetical protein